MDIRIKSVQFWVALSLIPYLLFTEAKATATEIQADGIRILEAQLLAEAIDGRVATMRILSKNIANDHHIHHWVDNGLEKTKESILLRKLEFVVNEYGLTSASFADTRSNRYWNHEGFLRVLDPEIDTWYFAFLQSENHNLISVYHDKNKHRIDLYVNYRQAVGNGLSGVATSFNGVVNMMADSSLGQQGTVYLVDETGTIQVHQDLKLLEKTSLQDKVGIDLISNMRNSNTKVLTEHIAEKNINIDIVALPNMGWYLVVESAAQ